MKARRFPSAESRSDDDVAVVAATPPVGADTVRPDPASSIVRPSRLFQVNSNRSRPSAAPVAYASTPEADADAAILPLPARVIDSTTGIGSPVSARRWRSSACATSVSPRA